MFLLQARRFLVIEVCARRVFFFWSQHTLQCILNCRIYSRQAFRNLCYLVNVCPFLGEFKFSELYMAFIVCKGIDAVKDLKKRYAKNALSRSDAQAEPEPADGKDEEEKA